MKFSLFLESAHHENQAKNILKKKHIPNPEEALFQFKEWFGKENRKYFPLAAFFYNPERVNFRHIIQDFLSISRLFSVNVTNKKVKIRYRGKDYTFDQSDASWQEFEHFVHAVQAEQHDKNKLAQIKKGERGGKLIIDKNHIEIRLARDAWDAISLGRGTPFCISRPGTPHFNFYRLKQQVTTYFIFDNNFPSKHPLHVVVYMAREGGNPLLTDLENTTGTIQNPYNSEEDRGSYIQEYQDYLRQQGIPVKELLVPLPLTKEEKSILERFEHQIKSTEEFKNLSPEDKLHYLTMGHELTSEQLEYLIDYIQNHPFDYPHIKVLHHYFYSGQPIPKKYFPVLKKLEYNKTNLFKHYLKYRKEAHNAGYTSLFLNYEEYQSLSEKEKREVKWFSKLHQTIGAEFHLDKFKDFVRQYGQEEIFSYPGDFIQDMNFYPVKHQLAAYDYLFSLGKIDKDFMAYATQARDNEVLAFLLEKAGQHNIQVVLTQNLAQRILSLPPQRAKKIVQTATHLRYFSYGIYEQHIFQLLFQVFDDEEVIEYIRNNMHTGHAESFLVHLVRFLSSCFLFSCRNSFVEKALKRLLTLIEESGLKESSDITQLLFQPQLPSWFLDKFISLEHPLVKNTIVNILSKLSYTEKFLYRLSSSSLVSLVQRYMSQLFRDKHIAVKILKNLEFLFVQNSHEEVKKQLLSQLLSHIPLVVSLLYDYVHLKQNEPVVFSLLEEMGKPKHQNTLFQVTKYLFHHREYILYLWVAQYYSQHRPEALDNFYITPDLQSFSPEDVDYFLYFTDKILLIPYTPLHQLLVQAIGQAFFSGHDRDAIMSICTILDHLKHFRGSLRDIAHMIVVHIRQEGFRNTNLDILAYCKNKRKLFQLISRSNQLTSEELNKLAQLFNIPG